MGDDVIDATARLLNAVHAGDYATYSQLSDTSLTAVEPETQGHIISGLGFHKHFFDLARGASPSAKPLTTSTICSPHVRMLGPDHACIVYIRVTQSGGKVTTAEETRVWRRDGKQWKNVHFHRSSKL